MRRGGGDTGQISRVLLLHKSLVSGLNYHNADSACNFAGMCLATKMILEIWFLRGQLLLMLGPSRCTLA